MTNLEEPISRVLEDFCHVEWFEVDELAVLVKSGGAKFDVPALRRQFEMALANSDGIGLQVNALTANEFESDDEARNWLLDIYRTVF